METYWGTIVPGAYFETVQYFSFKLGSCTWSGAFWYLGIYRISYVETRLTVSNGEKFVSGAYLGNKSIFFNLFLQIYKIDATFMA